MLDLYFALRTTILFGLGLTFGRRVAEWLARRQGDEELVGRVSESSRLIAAWRAIESLQDDSILKDPFALFFCGQAAYKKAARSAQPFKVGTAAVKWRRKHKISNVAARVWWFDRQILTALGAGCAEHAVPLEDPRTAPQQSEQSVRHVPLHNTQGQSPQMPGAQPASATHTNVVVLGSGMDTRPWRLALPSGVRWYEIDRPDVLQAKRRVLHQLGMQLAKEEGDPSNDGQGQLQCESWTAVEADLCHPDWTRRLEAAGFDPGLPTLWVAEGLLMYLEPAEGMALLQAIAEVSSPGSKLVMHNVTEELVEKLKEGGPVDYSPFSMELMQTWHFGLPPDPSKVLRRAGWQLEAAVSRAQIAQDITGGLVEGTCDFETKICVGRDRYAVFVVASKI